MIHSYPIDVWRLLSTELMLQTQQRTKGLDRSSVCQISRRKCNFQAQPCLASKTGRVTIYCTLYTKLDLEAEQYRCHVVTSVRALTV